MPAALNIAAVDPAALRHQLTVALAHGDYDKAVEMAIATWPRLVHALAQNGALAWRPSSEGGRTTR